MSQPIYDDESVAPPEKIAEPRLFGRYRLSHQLASGGMGTVYLARAEGPGGFQKLVALKRIHPHLATDRRFVNMFLDEARIAARIQHPNVCSVIDFGELEGSYYLTMPFIFGEPLHRVLKAAVRARPELRNMLPWMACRLVADACEGLHAAHELKDEQGRLLDVVHRDVSPQNLMVGYDGSLRVLDFGVASARHRHYRTSTGEVKGKFAYLAPEQIEGQAADRRADVWALGVVLWESVAGRRLFHHESMAATVRAVTDGPIPPLRERFPGTPLGLEEVVGKALARDPERRYPSARAMGRDLLTVLAEEQRFVGPADVAEWMENLFPRGREEKEQLIDESHVLSLSEVSGIAEKTELSPALDHPSHPGAPRPDAARPAVKVEGSVKKRSPGVPRALLIGLGLVVIAFGLVAGVGTAWLLLGPSDPSRIMGTGRVAGSPDESPPPPPVSTDLGADPGDPAAVAGDEDVEPSTVAEAADVEAPDPAGTPEAAEPTATSDDEPQTTLADSPPEVRNTPRREPADRVRHMGRVAVATPGGWALVTHGRRTLGEAPGTFELPAGPQVIGVQPFGRGSVQRRRVNVPPNGTVRISVAVN